MKQNYTKLIAILDRSTSMHSIKSDIIGGYNAFLETQKNETIGKCDMSLYQFDTGYETVYEDLNIADVPNLTDRTFVPRGMTSLYDAIGKTIENVGRKLSNTPEEDRPEKVLVLIITDGDENSSREFTQPIINEKIKHQTEKYNWNFAYIGSNQDAWKTGSSLGIANNLTYANNTVGVNAMFRSVSDSTTTYRASTASFSIDASAYTAQEKAGATNNIPTKGVTK